MALFAGRDYPGSYAELRAWFNEDWKCLDYLDWLRWPDGFVCPWCASQDRWRAPSGRWRCVGCDRRVSATAGTIVHGTRTPLTLWCSAAWHLTSGKGGISAAELRREMHLGSYQTVWAMLHRYRSVMVRPGRNRFTGDVEVDESFLGGPEAGIPGRGALGKVPFAAAVKVNSPSGFCRARLGVIKDASAASLQQSLLDNVEPGSCILTDGWAAYPKAIRGRYTRKATSVSASGRPAHEALPGVHLVFSLVKRWVMGTLHGSISAERMPAYFDEWVFRRAAATHAAAACSFSVSSSRPLKATHSPTTSCARPAGPDHRHHHRTANACVRPASNAKIPVYPGATTQPDHSRKLRQRDGDPLLE
ncbi:MAG: IS1595 family transposase [Actinobacteria bacterium]|nr:IS1595 family transposase [Actinomycetota bacterium]